MLGYCSFHSFLFHLPHVVNVKIECDYGGWIGVPFTCGMLQEEKRKGKKQGI